MICPHIVADVDFYYDVEYDVDYDVDFYGTRTTICNHFSRKSDKLTFRHFAANEEICRKEKTHRQHSGAEVIRENKNRRKKCLEEKKRKKTRMKIKNTDV